MDDFELTTISRLFVPVISAVIITVTDPRGTDASTTRIQSFTFRVTRRTVNVPYTRTRTAAARK